MNNKPAGKRVGAIRRDLTTPRSAAVAGILFAVLFGVCLGLIAIAFPEGVASAELGDLAQQKEFLRLALGLLPFAGIAFLWFIGVVRDLLGDFEDQFFSTVFFGSGLLFLAMMFVAGALAGGILAAELAGANSSSPESGLAFGRVLMYQITHNYGIRMAGVFMLSLGTIWFRTGLMPRWLALLTLISALILIVVFNTSFTISLIFPTWVLLISIYILLRNRRSLPPSPDVEK